MKATPIPVSSRLAVRNRAKRRCERCGSFTKGEWHHRRSRSIRDDLTHDPRNGAYLCPSDHRWVHAHPFEARAEGFIVSRYADPTKEPIKHFALGWVLLTDDSTYEGFTGETQ